MRKTGRWMGVWDDRIMEFIRENGPTSASKLVENEYIHTSRSTISRRLNKLSDYDLLDRLPNGVYRLTEKGEQYLDEELDANSLEPIKDETSE